MRMDGDPHLTAWGTLDAEPIGGHRAIDLIPQQVVGGYFLMGTEEKGRVSQASGREFLDDRGGPVPESCQGDEPLLQPLRVLEGQFVGGNCQPGKENALLGVVEGKLVDGHSQPVEENATLALTTLDSSQDSGQNPLSYCTFESPPVTASETDITALSPNPLSQVPDQNIISPVHSPQGDCPSDYILNVPQLLVRVPALPPETDPLPLCPLVSAPDAHQMLSLRNRLLDETPLFTSKTFRQSDCKPLTFDYLTPETDQIPPPELCLPRIAQSLLPEPPVAPCTNQLPQSDSLLNPTVLELPQSECDMNSGAVALPQYSSQLSSESAQLLQSESCLESDSVQLPHSTVRLRFDTDHLSHFCPDPFSQSECCLNFDVDELPEAETCLNFSAGELPEADSCVISDANDFAEAETFLNHDGDLPEAEACLILQVNELPESDSCLSPGIVNPPEVESFAAPDVSELPEAESFLNPDGDLPEAEAGFNPGELTEAGLRPANVMDCLSQPQSCLHSDIDQLPQSHSFLDSEEVSLSESSLHPDAKQFSCPEPCLDFGLLPQSKPCFTTVSDQLLQIKSHLHSATCNPSQPELFVDHSNNDVKFNLACSSEQLSQSDDILDIDSNKLPQTTASSLDTDRSLLPQLEHCVHPGSGLLPTFDSSLGAEPDQLPHSKPFLNSDVDQMHILSRSESSLAAAELFPKGETSSAPEFKMLYQFDVDQNSAQAESCQNTQSDQVPDACLVLNTQQLAHCDSSLSLKIDQWPLSDPCSQPDLNQSPQSDWLLIPAFAQCSQSEPSLDTDKVSLSYSYFELDIAQSELSLVPSACDSPNSGPWLTPVIDHHHQSGLCSDSGIELLPLSETFLAHENDQLISSFSESDSGLMSHSETSSLTDQMPLFSDIASKETTGSEATHSDHLVTCERPLTNSSDQVSESGFCDDTELFCLCETFLACDIDQISLPTLPEALNADHLPVSESVLIHHSDQLTQSDFLKAPNVDHIPVSDSVLAGDTDLLPLDEYFLPQDAFPFNMATSTDNLALLREACLDSDSGHFLRFESCLNDDSEQVSPSDSSVSHNAHEMPLLEPPLPSHGDQLLPSAPLFAFETDDQLPLHNSSVANTSCLPLLESYVDLDHDNMSKFDSSLHNHLPLSDSVLAEDADQFIESSSGHSSNQLPQSESFHSTDLLHLSECLLAPNLDDLSLSDLCLTPDIDQFPLDVTSVDPDTEISLFDELLTSDANHSLLPKSIVSPISDELSLIESRLSSNADHLLLSHMSGPPHQYQFPFSYSNALLKEDKVRLCQSLVSPNVDYSLSESFLKSSTGQLPQSVDQTSLDSASEFAQITSANTSFSNSIVEEFQIPWDWTSDLDSAEFAGVALDCASHIDLNSSPNDPENPASQVHDIDDCFPLFCLDTPPESPIESPEIDQLTLSNELLSLCDVFSHLQANDTTCPKINSELCCALDSLSVHQTDREFRTDQVTIVKEEISRLNDPQSANLSHMPVSNGQVNFLNGGDKTFNGISNHNFREHDVDQSDSYCLDLLFEPKPVSCETQSSPSSPTVDPCPQFHFDPSFRSITSNASGHLLCDVTKPSKSHVYETPSTPPLENLCVGDHFSPACQSDSPFHNTCLAQSNSFGVTEMGSTSELLGETVQPSLIVGKDPLVALIENNQDVLLAKSQEALPPDKLVLPEIDTHMQDEEVPACDVKGPVLLISEEPDGSQMSARPSDFGEQFPPRDTTQSKPRIGFESPPSLPCGIVEQIEKLALSRTVSPLENTQVLPCDFHQPADPQDSASAPFSFGEGDPFLGFALDNDSPCVGDELARLRAVFDALDRDKDGFVKMEDFVQFATVYGAEQVKYLTGYLDPAGLGVINFRDFYRGISEIQNEDLDMQLYDMGYPSEGEPACSVDFDDLAAFEVTEVTDSAYVGSESAYSECETFTDEDTGGLATQEDPETEGDGTGSRGNTSASPEGLELSLCDISVVTVSGQEEQFEDFGEGAEPDLFNSHCEDEPDSFTQMSNSTQRLTSSVAPVSERQLLAPPPCSALGGMYCSQCHKHINRLEDLSTRLRYLEMDSPDKRTCSRKEARRLHHSGFLAEEPVEQQQTEMAYDETDLTDKVLYLEQRVSELERDATTTGEQQNRLRQENLQLLHRAHALEEQLKDQELQSDEVQSEETRKHRDEMRKMERDRSYRLTSLKARLQELENENLELRSQLPSAKASTQRLEEEKHKLLDQVEDLQLQLQDHQEQNQKLGGKLSKEMHKQQTEKERCQEVIEELRRELEQMQLIRLEMEQRMGLGNSAALQEYNSRTREAELEQEVRRLKQEQRALKEQNEELNGQIINLSIQGAKNLFSTTFSDSLAAEISSVSRDELMEAIQKQEEINLRLQDYIDRIIVAIMETNPAILEVKIH